MEVAVAVVTRPQEKQNVVGAGPGPATRTSPIPVHALAYKLKFESYCTNTVLLQFMVSVFRAETRALTVNRGELQTAGIMIPNVHLTREDVSNS